jgi:hypothetical protein
MNEQIRLLAEQAGFDWALNRSSLYGYNDDKQNLEKFAELIVREMLKTCAEHPAWYGRTIAEEIKRHFGVEE